MTYNKSYYERHKEKVKIKNKMYCEENRELRNEKNDCMCGGSFTTKNKSSHLKTYKHNSFLNIVLKKKSILNHQSIA